MRSFCNLFGLGSFILFLLTGCGGGGGSSSPATPVTAGVYSNTANGDEIVTVLAPESLVASSTPNWFGFKFTNGNNYPDLYSARVTGVGSTSASSSTATKHFQGISSPRTNGTASISMTLADRLSNGLSFAGNSQESALSINWLTDQLGSTQYVYASVATALSGNWTGKWYFGLNTSNDKTLTLSSGNVTGSQSVITNCNLESSQINPLNGVNLYEVSLYISVNTNCTLSSSNTQPTLYKGLAFMDSPSGGSHRLQIMAASTDGKALFFRSNL